MKKLGFGLLAGSLTLVIGVAVSTLLAQTPAPAPPDASQGRRGTPAPAPRPERQELRRIDIGGSRLGLSVRDLTADELKGTGVAAGPRIDDVDRDGAAAKAGAQAGDIVVAFDGERVRSARHLSRLVQETADGRTVKMDVVRDGQARSFDVTPERLTAWNFGVDEDRIRRDVERGLRGLERLPYFDFRGQPFEWDRDMPGIRAPRGRLGVQLETLTPQLADYFGAKGGGVLVSGVTAGSAAEKAGLKAGDVIVSINGAQVDAVDELREELRETTGTDLTIGIVREKKETTLKGSVPAQQRR